MSGYLHAIGTTLGGMVTLESLGIKVPEPDYAIETEAILTAAKTVESMGSPTEAWHWGFIAKAKRDLLKTYCTERSAYVYIKTIDNEGNYKVYNCLMVWPEREKQSNGRIIDFTLKFLFLVEVEE